MIFAESSQLMNYIKLYHDLNLCFLSLSLKFDQMLEKKLKTDEFFSKKDFISLQERCDHCLKNIYKSFYFPN